MPVVSHPENSGCFETIIVSESNIHLTIERGTVNTAQVQSDLHEFTEAAESEKSSILDTSDELEFRKYIFNQSSEPDSDIDSLHTKLCSGNLARELMQFFRQITLIGLRGCFPVVHCGNNIKAQ